MTQTDNFVSARAAAALLGMDDRTLRREIKRGELPAQHGPTKNSPLRIALADVQALAERRGVTLQTTHGDMDARTGEVQAEPREARQRRPGRPRSASGSGTAASAEALQATLAAARRLLELEPSPQLWEAVRAVLDVDTADDGDS